MDKVYYWEIDRYNSVIIDFHIIRYHTLNSYPSYLLFVWRVTAIRVMDNTRYRV